MFGDPIIRDQRHLRFSFGTAIEIHWEFLTFINIIIIICLPMTR